MTSVLRPPRTEPPADPDVADGGARRTRAATQQRWMTNLDPSLRRCWHPVAASADVGSSPVGVTLLGQDWLIVRIAGALAALEDRCPHRLAPLRFGAVVDGTIQCPYHGYRFDAQGRCVRIPAMPPDVPVPQSARCAVPAGIEERYGLIWLAPDDPITPMPDFPEWGDPAYAAVYTPPRTWRATAAQMADNYLDMSHLPFAHRGTIGDPDDEIMAPYTTRRDGWRFDFVIEHTAKRLADSLMPVGAYGRERRRLTFTATAPHHVHLKVEYLETGTVMVATFFHQPVDEGSTTLWTWTLRTDIAEGQASPADAVAFQYAIGREDQLMLERLKVKAIPLDLTTEVHTRADRATIELRRMLAELAAATAIDE